MFHLTTKMSESDAVGTFKFAYLFVTKTVTVHTCMFKDLYFVELQWFEEKQLKIETLEQQLKKLHQALEGLVGNRKGRVPQLQRESTVVTKVHRVPQLQGQSTVVTKVHRVPQLQRQSTLVTKVHRVPQLQGQSTVVTKVEYHSYKGRVP